MRQSLSLSPEFANSASKSYSRVSLPLGSGDSNSDPHGSTASTLSTEAYPQLW